jgi:periplasmic divalent cation tolerance protein
MSYIVVTTTCSSAEEADRLASELLEKRLAACVQSNSIHSAYRWKGTIERTAEVQLSIKARASDFLDIQALIQSMHSYQNPEIISLPVISGSAAYLKWIGDETDRAIG